MISFSAVLAACGEGSLDPLVAKGNSEEILSAVSAAEVISTAVPDDDFAQQALAAINAARAAGQICGEDEYPAAGAVLWNDRIAHASLLESEWMQRDNDFGHAWPDGTRVGDRLTMANYAWQHADENIAAGFRTLPEVIQAWIDSPSHCRALMRPDVSETGLAVVPGTAGNTYVSYWTMVLAEPAATNRREAVQ
ncbi:MAG: CAP domain-containing protein [Burkholderiaceae bacterium]